MPRVKPRTMSGVMELLPGEQVAFQAMLDVIRAGFERFGFLPIETPVLELIQVLLTKSGGDTEKQVYFAQSSGNRKKGIAPDLALRFDLTVPLARYVAEHEHGLTFPFRRYQLQRVYRGERAQRGRFREFYQCDVDVIGKNTLSMHFDGEIPAVIHSIFNALNFGPFTIYINNRKVLQGMLRALGVTDLSLQAKVLLEIDKLDKIGAEKVADALEQGAGLSPEVVQQLLAFIKLEGTSDAILAQLDAAPFEEDLFREGCAELRTVVDAMRSCGIPDTDFQVKLAICRGLDYYTGTVYETLLDEHPELGSICSGGRYENLAGHYTASKLPGVGISIGATRLFDQLRHVGLVSDVAGPTRVLVTQQDPAFYQQYLAIASTLRAAGINTELYMEQRNLKKQLTYAQKQRIPVVVIAGAVELEAGAVQVKNMQTGEQHKVALDALVEAIPH